MQQFGHHYLLYIIWKCSSFPLICPIYSPWSLLGPCPHKWSPALISCSFSLSQKSLLWLYLPILFLCSRMFIIVLYLNYWLGYLKTSIKFFLCDLSPQNSAYLKLTFKNDEFVIIFQNGYLLIPLKFALIVVRTWVWIVRELISNSLFPHS